MGGEIRATYLVLVMLTVLSSLKRLAHYSHNTLERHSILQMGTQRHGEVE